MKFFNIFLLCALAYCAHLATAEHESKYNEIIRLLSDSDVQLKPAAQTYSASVADPSDYPSHHTQGSQRRQSPKSHKQEEKDEEDAKIKAEEEEDKKPDRLALLLADSKFTCDGLKNGYYADESVGCQVFHYCVEGVKHSWQCPENTVFHQIHLNCVPNTLDICGESSKFHVVNDYLHKELNERGPNNTILYHQRYYPEGFDVSGGDPVVQIFQAHAQAALQKAQNKAQGNSDDYEDEPPVRARPPSRPKPQYTPQPAPRPPQQPSRPVYKQPASRPVSIPATYSPAPPPTKRPLAYTTPESYSPPAYTESSNDDDDDYSPPSHSSPSSSSSSSSSNSNSGSSFPSASLSSGNSFGSGSNYSPSSSSSFSPSSHSGHSSQSSHSSHSSHSQPSSSFRPSSSSRPSYPTRSLGIPIASFRVAPSREGYSSQASTLHEVNVAPVLNIAAAGYNQPIGGYYF